MCDEVKRSAYFLVGPTAAGKTEVAHILARRRNWAVFSIDSMLVYRGMDIGTAKPGSAEREGIVYFGLDLVDACEDFSLAMFCRYASDVLRSYTGGLIVCGGTGLYAKAITAGLDTANGPDNKSRMRWEKLLADRGVEALQDELRSADAQAYDRLPDKDNPRRLVRALEHAASGARMDVSARWRDRPVFTGISSPPSALAEKIERRVDSMYSGGLVDEVRGLLARFGCLSRTASQAIGYAEVIEYIRGGLSLGQAKERTKARTRQLAKKQRTWFRNQASVDWIDASGLKPDRAADLVEASWSRTGKTMLNFHG